MQIIKVKIKDKTNGAIIEVKKSLVADYIGTGKYEEVKPMPKKFSFKEENNAKSKN